VLGAAAERVAPLIPEDVQTVVAEDWAQGMGASLRAGLAELSARWGGGPASAGSVPAGPLPAAARVSAATAPAAATRPDAPAAPPAPAAVVHLVDLPGVGAPAVARLVAVAAEGPTVLARAAYRGVPGHPVLLGRDHWPGVAAAAHGDAGARGYLAGHPALRLVECADVADPDDVDTPDALQGFTDRLRS
jgi:nicotine blue oxidoreductase